MATQHPTGSKPYLLFCSTPIAGHITPLVSPASPLLSRGYSIGFLTGTQFQPKILSQNFSFFPLDPRCDFTESNLNSHFPAREKIENARERAIFDVENVILGTIVPQHESLQAALKILADGEKGRRDVIVLCDCGFLGVLPGLLGAGKGRPKGYITVGVTPLHLSSIDVAPFGTTLLPDSSPEGRERNLKLRKEHEAGLQPFQDRFLADLEGLSIDTSKIDYTFLDAAIRLPDWYLQIGVEELEYPRSDLLPNVRFLGAVPVPAIYPSLTLPPFWNHLLEARRKGTKIVAVSQSTMQESTPANLIIPTILALASDPNILVVAVLARRGAFLPPKTKIPDNVRVLDFFPFEVLLQNVDAFMWEGGYGGVMHAIRYGVPLVIAGDGADKPEVAMRVQWSGLGINLKTATPTQAQIKTAVHEVLHNTQFKKAAQKLQASLGKLDGVKIVEESINSILSNNKP